MPSQIGEQILRYLVKNPEAGDTIEGIVEWWLLEQRIENQLAETRRELERLISLDFVQEIEGPGGRIHYRLNQSRRGEISELLNGMT